MPQAKIRLPLLVATRMVADYVGVRLRGQLKSVAFIVIYLVAFQVLVFGSAPAQALRIACGIALVVIGLAVFLEGLLLGLMPLAERVGIKLSSKGGFRLIVAIGFMVGLGSTLAEPAMAGLRATGVGIAAWEAPLLFYLLQRNPQHLIVAIGIGVGAAVAFGMIRFYIGFSIKPVILVLVPILLMVTLLFSRSASLSTILGLAWDAGAVTTGPVTVPLILALGIGVSRSSGKSKESGSGFGVVMLASAFPVLAVMLFGLALLPKLPAPTSEEEFFAPANREQILLLFGDEEQLAAYAFSHGSENTREAFAAQGNPEGAAHPPTDESGEGDGSGVPRIAPIFLKELNYAARAVLPLTALLGVVLFFVVRDRPRYFDEVFLGIAFAFAGMALLTTGIETGLRPLGNETGERIPQVFRATEVERGRIVVRDFDPDIVFPAATADGDVVEAFHLFDGNQVRAVEFNPEWFDPETRIYTHRIRTSPLTHPSLSRVGILLVLLFAFGMGYGTTTAEPALAALGRKVEDMTVGTIKGASLVRAVSVGVGVGLVAGVVRLLFAIPTVWMILPPYLLLLPLTLMSEEDFAGIAWDTGGVTTGPVTVPLVMAMGVSLGGQMQIVDRFAILSMASVYPILAVLLFGFAMRLRQRNAALAAEGASESA